MFTGEVSCNSFVLLSLLPFATAGQILKANLQEVVSIYATARPGVHLYRNIYFLFCGGELGGVTALAVEEAFGFRLFFLFFFFFYGHIGFMLDLWELAKNY